MKKFRFALMAPLLVVGLGVAVADDGSVKGTVVFNGEAPAPEKLEITKDQEKCGTEKLSESLVVSASKGVKWAVVTLVGADSSAAPELPEATLDQNGCQFIPHVVVVPRSADLPVKNSDGILHNVHTYSEKNPPLNKAQPGFRKVMSLNFGEDELIKVTCDAHPWMAGWIMVTENRFVTVTDDDGAFQLDGIPAGSYELKLWHETLGEQSQMVSITAGGSTDVKFELTSGELAQK